MKLLALSTMVLLVGAAAVARAQDLDASYQSLKEAQEKGDAAAVKKLAMETSALARKAATEAAPESADEKEAWTKRVQYAKDVDVQTEYALFEVALKSPPAAMADLFATLETQNPRCKYLDEGYASYLYALNQSGQSAKITPVAEKALANFPDNTDLLLVMVNSTFSANQAEKAQGYASRLLAAWSTKAKPEGIAEADFEKQKSLGLSRGYWVSGVVAGQRSQWSPADKNLRAALPYIKGNNAMVAPALFYLGLANYNLGKMTNSKAKILEGAKFSDDCAAIKSDYAQQAWKNSAQMKAEAGRMR